MRSGAMKATPFHLPDVDSCARNHRPIPCLHGASGVPRGFNERPQIICWHRRGGVSVVQHQQSISISTAASRSTSSSTGSDIDLSESDDFANNIWEPVPPTPALGRKRKVALLLGCAMLEVSLTGGIMWAPLLGALLLAVLQPTKAEIANRQDEAVKRAVAAAEVSMSRQLPVTPVESSAWLNRLNQEMWATFWQPFLLANNLSLWQDTVAAAAPRGWEVEIADVSIGAVAPELSNFQAFADPGTSAINALECAMAYDSSSVRLVVVGRGPLGAFTARVSGVRMKGRLRITPLLQHRMLLCAFKEPPETRVSLSISAPLFKTALSPGDLGQLDFIQGLVGTAIKSMLVEPKRMAISLDSDIRVEEAIATTLHLTVDSITGLPASAGNTAAAAAGSGGNSSSGTSSPTAAGKAAGPRIALVAIDTTTQVHRATGAVSPSLLHQAVLLRESLSLDLPRKQGIFRLEARDMAARGSGGGRGALLGSCQVWVAAARDGTTMFWAHDRMGAPLATRWSPSEAPWRVTLPMTGVTSGFSNLEVTLGVSVEPWVYKQPRAGTLVRRTPGPRVAILQVVEARGLSLPLSGGTTPNAHVQLSYAQECYSTSTHYNSRSPVFNETFAFQENSSMLTRRVKVEAWDEGATATASSRSSSHAGPSSRSSSSSSDAGHQSAGIATTVGSSTDGSSSSSRDGSSSSRRKLSGGKPSRALGLRSRDLGGTAGRLHYPYNSSNHSSSRAGPGSSSSSSSGNVLSHRLSDVFEESGPVDTLSSQDLQADVASHMLVDVELEDEQAVESEGQQLTQDDNSSSSSSAGLLSLGSVVVNLDQLAEASIQDRWFALSGSGGAEVRLRMVLLPGALPQSSSGSSSSTGGVSDMLSFFHRNLIGSSRPSVMVEVVSARLFLPLSSMDSSDIDQPTYMLSYNGAATVTLPPHLQPNCTQQRLQSPSKLPASSSSSGGNGSSSSSKRRSKRGGEHANDTFSKVTAGNVSQQVVRKTCLARSVFPLDSGSTASLAAAAAAGTRALLPPTSSSSSSGGALAAEAPADVASGTGTVTAARPLLKVQVFDPDDLHPISPAAGAAAAAAASALIDPPSSSSNYGVSAVEDIGCADIDVAALLAKAAVGGGGGSSSVAPAAATASAAAAATWEGWVKLDKEGGHLLVRLTQLEASDPADLAPPPSTIAASSSSSAVTAEASKAAAAAAAAVMVDGAAAKQGRGQDGDRDDVAHQIGRVLKQSYKDAESQVVGAVSQLTDVAGQSLGAAGSWINSSSSSIGGWISGSIPAWMTISGSSSSSNEQDSKQDQANQPPNSSNNAEIRSRVGNAQSETRKSVTAHESNQAAASLQNTAAAAAAGERGTQVATGQDVRTQELAPQQPPSSVDLRAIARAWGWGAADSTKQQQQQQRRHQPLQQQQQQDKSEETAAAGMPHSNASGILAMLDDVMHFSGKGPWQQQQRDDQQKQQQQGPENQQQQQQQPLRGLKRQTVLLDPYAHASTAGITKAQGGSSSSSSSTSSSTSRISTPTSAGLDSSSSSNSRQLGASQPNQRRASEQGQTATPSSSSSTVGWAASQADTSTRTAAAAPAADAAAQNTQGHNNSSSTSAELQPQQLNAQQQQQKANSSDHKPAAGAAGAAAAAAAATAAAIQDWPPLGSHPLAADAWSYYSYDGDAQGRQDISAWEAATEDEEL